MSLIGSDPSNVFCIYLRGTSDPLTFTFPLSLPFSSSNTLGEFLPQELPDQKFSLLRIIFSQLYLILLHPPNVALLWGLPEPLHIYPTYSTLFFYGTCHLSAWFTCLGHLVCFSWLRCAVHEERNLFWSSIYTSGTQNQPCHIIKEKSESVSCSVMFNSLRPLWTMGRSSPGSSVHGILQARILEWVAISFARGSSWTRNQTWVSCITGRFFTIWTTTEAPDNYLWNWMYLWKNSIQITHFSLPLGPSEMPGSLHNSYQLQLTSPFCYRFTEQPPFGLC